MVLQDLATAAPTFQHDEAFAAGRMTVAALAREGQTGTHSSEMAVTSSKRVN